MRCVVAAACTAWRIALPALSLTPDRISWTAPPTGSSLAPEQHSISLPTDLHPLAFCHPFRPTSLKRSSGRRGAFARVSRSARGSGWRPVRGRFVRWPQLFGRCAKLYASGALEGRRWRRGDGSDRYSRHRWRRRRCGKIGQFHRFRRDTGASEPSEPVEVQGAGRA